MQAFKGFGREVTGVTGRATPASPAVVVYVDPSRAGTALLFELLAGLEEEGVPGQVHVIPVSSKVQEPLFAVQLAYAAAKSSALEVGLGLDAQGAIALHHRRAEPNKPVFAAAGGSVDGLVARAFGSNAARLVKVQPLRLV